MDHWEMASLREQVTILRKEVKALEEVGKNIYRKLGDLEAWREEHDPIYKNYHNGHDRPGMQTKLGVPKGHKIVDDPQKEIREMPNIKLTPVSPGVCRVDQVEYPRDIGDLAPSRERKDMVFCPQCGHEL